MGAGGQGRAAAVQGASGLVTGTAREAFMQRTWPRRQRGSPLAWLIGWFWVMCLAIAVIRAPGSGPSRWGLWLILPFHCFLEAPQRSCWDASYPGMALHRAPCHTQWPSQFTVALGPTQLIPLPFPFPPSVSSNLIKILSHQTKQSLKGWITLSYVRFFLCRLWDLVKLGHLFFAHDSLYHFSSIFFS